MGYNIDLENTDNCCHVCDHLENFALCSLSGCPASGRISKLTRAIASVDLVWDKYNKSRETIYDLRTELSDLRVQLKREIAAHKKTIKSCPT
jgi:hypothetical protein